MNGTIFLKKSIFTVLFFIAVSITYAQTNAQVAHEHFKVSLENLMAGDYQNAILRCNQALRLLPNHYLSYIVRARAHFELNDFEKAITDCTNVIRLDKNNSTAYSIRGNSYRKIGETEKAITDWETALKLNPNLEDIKTNIERARVSLQ